MPRLRDEARQGEVLGRLRDEDRARRGTSARPPARTTTRYSSRPTSRSRARSGSAATPTTTCSSCSASGRRSSSPTRTTAGVYDTVYVDLDDDYRFDDEKPVTKSSPASYRDMNGDGYTDLSGGLLYYISDGSTPIPGGLDGSASSTTSYGAGRAARLERRLRPGDRGPRHADRVERRRPGRDQRHGADLQRPARRQVPGAVLGGAPNAKLAPFGDIYFSFDFSTQFGYFLATRHGVDVTSNSYGIVRRRQRRLRRRQPGSRRHPQRPAHDAALLHRQRRARASAPSTPPSPSAGISGRRVDAVRRRPAGTRSTGISQVTDNDVMVWSNRGLGATGSPGVDLVADGAYSAGDVTLNTVLDGRTAWETWGGTSRSTPVAAGATALVYQAWRQAHGGTIPAGFYTDGQGHPEVVGARTSATTRTIQGAGSLDAGGRGGRPRPARGPASRRTSGGSATTAATSTRSSRT